MASKAGSYLQLCRSFARLNSEVNKRDRIGIVGVLQNKGQGKIGVEQAPDALRSAGLVDALRAISDTKDIVDYGNIDSSKCVKGADPKNMKNWTNVHACNKIVQRQVQTILQESNQFLVLGGDHSIAAGSVAGNLAYDPNLALIWIDAHADINLNITSPSGNVHGMPVSFLLEELRSVWRGQMIECSEERLPAKRLAYIGLRDVDPQECYILKNLGIAAFGMAAVDKHGIHNTVEMALERIDPHGKLSYHISFDIDALDLKEAPSTGTPVLGGLTLREGICIMEKLAETGRVRGVDLVEVNPNIGTEAEIQRTVSASLEILKAAFGHNRLGNMKEIKELEKFEAIKK